MVYAEGQLSRLSGFETLKNPIVWVYSIRESVSSSFVYSLSWQVGCQQAQNDFLFRVLLRVDGSRKDMNTLDS